MTVEQELIRLQMEANGQRAIILKIREIVGLEPGDGVSLVKHIIELRKLAKGATLLDDGLHLVRVEKGVIVEGTKVR